MTATQAKQMERFLTRNKTVAQLIEELQNLPQDAIVVFQSDYGDYTHTQQALPIKDVDLIPASALYPNDGYSRSGVAIRDDQDDEDREEAEGIECDDPRHLVEVVVLK